MFLSGVLASGFGSLELAFWGFVWVYGSLGVLESSSLQVQDDCVSVSGLRFRVQGSGFRV